MLSCFSVSNFRSFKETTTIDLNALSYQLLAKTNQFESILKGALFVGANSSGKTNLIKALKLLLELIFQNHTINLLNEQNLFSQDAPLCLEYHFIIDQTPIHYSLTYELNSNQISEKLCIGNTVYFEVTSVSNDFYLQKLYLSKSYLKEPVLVKWFSFLENSIYLSVYENLLINPKEAPLDLIDYLDQYGTDFINSFFKELNFDEKVIYNVPSKQNIFLKQDKFNFISIQKTNCNTPMPYYNESLGNQQLLKMLPSLFYVIQHKGMLIVDEFSNGFHNDLGELIIKYFMRRSLASQLLIVSHSTNLLSHTIFRPDQLYAVDFDILLGSFVKRFSSENPRESQNLEKMYMSGVFGGLPRYGENNDSN